MLPHSKGQQKPPKLEELLELAFPNTLYLCDVIKHNLEDRYPSVLFVMLTSSKGDAALALVVSHNSHYQNFNTY